MKTIFIFVGAFVFLSCDEGRPFASVPFQDGDYGGIYKLVTKDGAVNEGRVSFSFGPPGKYLYRSEKYLTPPSGAGAYTTHDNKIVLTDQAFHTADFDWSLILNGEFFYSFDGKTLKMEQIDAQRGRTHTIVLNEYHATPFD